MFRIGFHSHNFEAKNICGKYLFVVPLRYSIKLNNESFTGYGAGSPREYIRDIYVFYAYRESYKICIFKNLYELVKTFFWKFPRNHSRPFFMENKEIKYFCKISVVSTFLTFKEVNAFITSQWICSRRFNMERRFFNCPFQINSVMNMYQIN